MTNHDSPVEQRMSSKNEVEKSLKFACSFSSSSGSPIGAIPNYERPMIANMKNRIIRRSPREPSEDAESYKVWKIIYSCCAFLIRRKMRAIRKDLRIVAPPPTPAAMPATFKSNMTRVKITIVKSKMFQESLK